MGIPITPVSLEKRSDIDDPFSAGRNGGDARQVTDRDQVSNLIIVLDGIFPAFSLEGLFEPWRPSEDDRLLREFGLGSVRPFIYDIPGFFDRIPISLRLNEDSRILREFGFPFSFSGIVSERNPVGPVREETKKSKNWRRENFSLYNEFLAYYFQHPPLLQFQNGQHSEHKKMSRCHPSHFWQVIE